MHWKPAFAGIRHRRIRAVLSATMIALSIIPSLVLSAIGSHRTAAAHSADSAAMRNVPQRGREAPQPSLQPFAAEEPGRPNHHESFVAVKENGTWYIRLHQSLD